MFLLYLLTHWPLVGTSLWWANVGHNAWIKEEARSQAVFLLTPTACGTRTIFLFSEWFARSHFLPIRSKLHRFTVDWSALSADAFCPTFRPYCLSPCCKQTHGKICSLKCFSIVLYHGCKLATRNKWSTSFQPPSLWLTVTWYYFDCIWKRDTIARSRSRSN